MEIKEFQNALFKKKEGTLTHEEFKTSVEHVIAAGLLLPLFTGRLQKRF